MSDYNTESKTVDEVALDHAWKWFEYHASQRMTMIRFYVTAVGGIAAATGVLLSSQENLLAGLVSLLGLLTSLAFKRLDKRVSDLVGIGENALKSEQAKMSSILGSETFEICRLAGEKPSGASLYTYGENLRFLFKTLAVGFFLVAIISFSRFAESHVAQICQYLK